MTKIKEIFLISKGKGGYQSELAPGAIPLVSCKTDNNGFYHSLTSNQFSKHRPSQSIECHLLHLCN